MRVLTILMLTATLLVVVVPPVHRPFALMTLLSTALLWLLPTMIRGHIGKVGTYAHEVCHGTVSFLTGGEFHSFQVRGDGGLSITSGGKRVLVIAAGYVGTVLLGAIFLARSAQDESLTLILYLVAILVALSTLKAGDIHTIVIGHVVALTLGTIGLLAPGSLTERFLMNLLGVVLVWQGLVAIWDLYRLSATQSRTGSDAEAMAVVAGGTPLLWAVVYGGLAIVILLVLGSALLHPAGF
ncbi:MAG: M50 family metallopeptidase [Planctomycetes bacterium]|nr:M50 family metallopeptidase [Planctomycetota bacterium]